tara:strand:+ start:4049 stop:5116 length:1068 start_codon:yes stop_codon:yes gene_type:complete
MSDSTPIGSYEGIVPFSGIFDAILQSSAQRAFMETEGMYTQAEEQFESAQRDLRDIQFTVPQDKQADAVAKYLRDAGYSSDVVSQTLGIPKAEVNAVLMAAGYDATGQPLPEEDVFADTTKDKITLDDGMAGLIPEVEGVVTDDPNQIWEDTDKDALDLKGFIDLAFDVFGAYNKDAITNVVDLVNQRGISVGDVAQATGNSVESINQAATESGTAIENQGTGEITVKNEGPAIGPQQPITVDEAPAIGPQLPTGGATGDDTVVGGNGNNTVVVSDVFPEGDTVISDQPVEPTIITGPRGEKGDPGKTGLIMALSQQAPITEQMFSRELFEPQLRELANVPKALGMIQAIGRRFV